MHICIINDLYYPLISGNNILLSRLAEGIVRRGGKCTIITTRFPGGNNCEIVNGVEIRRIPVPLSGSYSGHPIFFQLAAVLPLLRSEIKPDIIHASFHDGGIAAFIAGKILRKLVTVTFHEPLGAFSRDIPWVPWYDTLTLSFYEKILFALPFDFYFCDSLYAWNSLRVSGLPDRKLRMVYPGVDSSFASTYKTHRADIRERLGLSGAFVGCFFGRPSRWKRVDYIIQAVPHILKALPNFKLLLILGTTVKSDYDYIINLIKILNISEAVLIHNPVPRENLPDLVSASDCVICSSVTEGFGLMVAEACLLGIPVVATQVGALTEVVSGPHVFVEPRNPLSLAQGVIRISTHKWDMAPQKSFDWEETVSKYWETFERLKQDRNIQAWPQS